ncbi:MAG: FlgD immunoglobulin-like domain containing protein [Candidatus Latescibacterota bacterium]
MTRNGFLRLLLAAVLIWSVTAIPVVSQTDVWIVGKGGQSWEEPADVIAGLVVGADGELRPVNFELADNVIGAITWQDSRPVDLVSESQGHVWDNAAAQGSPAVIVDGDASTTTGDRFKTFGIDQTGRIFFLDLGASFPASQISFFPSPQGEADFVRAFSIAINDGTLYGANNTPIYETLRFVEQNRDPLVDIRFPPQLLRFIKLTVRSPGPFEIAEIEVHGEGFVPRGSYLSQLVELPDPVNFGQLTFKARRIGSDLDASGGGGSVSVQMRNGSDETPLEYYQIVDLETGAEQVVTKAEYDAAASEERGSIRPDLTNWSPWTEPIVADADSIHSARLELPGPRPFFQYRLAFEGTSTDGMQVDSLAITNSAALAAQAVAEVALLSDPNPAFGIPSVRAGVDTTLTYDVLVDMGAVPGTGFDGLRIVTSAVAEFVKLELGPDLAEVTPDSVREETTELLIYFPSNRITEGRDERLRVTFRSRLFLFSTEFSGQLLDTRGSLPQALAEGDASAEVGSNSLRMVFDRAGEHLVQGFEIVPRVITPNGDGVNDEAAFTFALIHLVQPAPSQVSVYDLSGRLVRDVSTATVAAGIYSPVWDGTDEAGSPVPPGVYLARINIETATGDIAKTSLVHVAY